MDIKELFDKAENGTLTYDQFVKASSDNKAKFIDLSEGNYVDKQKYTDDLAARDTRINTLDTTIKDRDTDLANLQEQLKNAGTDADKLSNVSKDLTDLQSKYDKDTKALQKQLRDQAYKFAVDRFADEQNFTSKAAKRDFVSSLMAKNLQIENDVIVGATDFRTAYANENPDAFVVDKQEPEEQQKAKPHFVDPTHPEGSKDEPAGLFNFSFQGVRSHK